MALDVFQRVPDANARSLPHMHSLTRPSRTHARTHARTHVRTHVRTHAPILIRGRPIRGLPDQCRRAPHPRVRMVPGCCCCVVVALLLRCCCVVLCGVVLCCCPCPEGLRLPLAGMPLRKVGTAVPTASGDQANALSVFSPCALASPDMCTHRHRRTDTGSYAHRHTD